MVPFIQNFRKYNFRNDHVITKITKIFYYENLELYGNWLLSQHDFYSACLQQWQLECTNK